MAEGERRPTSNRSLHVPLLSDLAPDGFFYGGHYVVEFDPDSIWYETSLTIAALALKHRTKVEYHVFQHFPDEAREAFSRLGVDVARLRERGLLNIIDSYTQTVEYRPEQKEDESHRVAKSGDKPLDLVKSAENWARQAIAGYTDRDKRWLHIDDNTGIFLRYNDERIVIDKWRTAIIPYSVRARETPHIISFPKGVASDSFYSQFEAQCDGVIELKTSDEGGTVENYIRIRTIRGKSFDSKWHRLRLASTGEVSFAASSTGESRRLAAIMYTDMVGYTSLSQKNESLSLSLVQEQRALIRPLLSSFNGREVKTMGDAVLAEFPNALDAVKCSCEIQKAARKHNAGLPAEQRISLRIGIHLGDIVDSQGDILGDAVNVASRIEPFAEDGGVCITRQVYDHVQNKFELPLLSLGTKSLKNVNTPVEVYKMQMPWKEEANVRAASLDKKRIAVLPFANISPSPSDEYFADGMTEELITVLSRIRDLGVIARTSIVRYKGQSKPVGEIGRELNIGTVLEGSVRVAGKKLRITAQLVDVATEEHIWSETYDRDLEDALSIQTDIAKRIAKALKIRLLRHETMRLEKKATGIPEAYSLYLKGRHSLAQRTEKALKEAIHYFENAIKRDQTFALAYTGLADAYSILASYSLEYVPPREGFPKAKIAAEKALSLDDHLAEAHASLGLVKFYYDWDWAGAETEFKKALELNPGYAEAHQYYADFLKSFGRFDEALAQMQKALTLDPLSYSINTGIGHVLYLSRQYDQAIEQYRKVVESDPAFIPARLWFGRPYIQKGMFKEAIVQSKEGARLAHESTVSLATLAQAYASAGEKNEAKIILDRLQERSTRQYVPAYWIALVQMSMGNKDEAIGMLERAYHERSSWLVWANVEPRFDSLRSDPRFTSLLRRIGFEDDKP